ncbi:Transcription factor WhiB [uncultured Caudovirales phage]|uniref:Transcription factor WhiB n=1 Tax=uncultured Caudovirales phage TaxID=2100421 RepID=A0A6J5KV33_9CAUD|nr:Transcription factor WhiB [uncultured Caudovirales phage]
MEINYSWLIEEHDYVDHSWRTEARCHGEDTELFYPPRDKTQYKKIAAEAKVFCLGENGKNPCPVRKECLWYAVETDELHGIWGGLSHRERNAIVRKWQKKYKSEMTLKEYIFQHETRVSNGSK